MKSSDRRTAANRANAAKSTGPRTPDGKKVSSRNAVRHGLSSATFVADNEDLDEYYELRNAYMTRFGPRDRVESDLIDRMVHANWIMLRAWTMQNETLNIQMYKMEGSLEAEFSGLPERTRTAMAFAVLATEPTLNLLNRYEARQSNEYQRAMKTLIELRKTIPLAPIGPLIPESEQEPVQTNPFPVPDTPQTEPPAQNTAPPAPRTAAIPPQSATPKPTDIEDSVHLQQPGACSPPHDGIQF